MNIIERLATMGPLAEASAKAAGLQAIEEWSANRGAVPDADGEAMVLAAYAAGFMEKFPDPLVMTLVLRVAYWLGHAAGKKERT